jgi:D-glycero-alpha-D-manno-heptose-7-phosphate kinase
MADVMDVRQYQGFCRVDWVGGTTDLWPIYCHMGSARVINMAIPVAMNVDVSRTKGPFSLKISSVDMGKSSTHTSLASLNKDLEKETKVNPLRWIHRVIARCMEIAGVKDGAWAVKIKSDAPPGSGLGGSSVLGVTLAHAIFDFAGVDKSKLDPWFLHQMVMNLESAEIEKPAGEQDYIPALFGGLISFYLSADRKKVDKYPDKIGESLADRSALIHTGKPHHSGINNWDVFKKYHEGNETVRGAMHDVRLLAEEMHDYLMKGDVERFIKSINKEWEFRKKLSRTFDAPVLKQAWDFAKKEGAIARKACGAGGGGSLLVVFESSKARDKALTKKLPKTWTWIPLALQTKALFDGV